MAHSLLEESQKPGFLGEVSDEGEFWQTRRLERLNTMLKALARASLLGDKAG